MPDRGGKKLRQILAARVDVHTDKRVLSLLSRPEKRIQYHGTWGIVQESRDFIHEIVTRAAIDLTECRKGFPMLEYFLDINGNTG